MRTNFQDWEIDKLRERYDEIDKLPLYCLEDFCKILDSCSVGALKQLATAKVNFASTLAAARCRRRGIEI